MRTDRNLQLCNFCYLLRAPNTITTRAFIFLDKSPLVTHFTGKKILNGTENLVFDKVHISVPCFTSDLSVCNTPQVLLRMEIENYAIQMNSIILKRSQNLFRIETVEVMEISSWC